MKDSTHNSKVLKQIPEIRQWERAREWKEKILSCSFRYAVDHCVFMFFPYAANCENNFENSRTFIKYVLKYLAKNLTPWLACSRSLLCLVVNDTGSLCCFCLIFLLFVMFFAVSLFPPTLYIKFYRVDISHSYSLQKYHNLSDLCYSLFYWQALAPYNKHFCISLYFDMKL